MQLPEIEGGWEVILSDPPWRFKSNSVEKPGRNAMRHYDTMTLAEIEALPVRDVVARDALLAFWITGPLLVVGAHLPIFKAWGFKPSAMGFVWIKTNRRHVADAFTESDLFMGGGFTTRKNAEFIVFGKRGRSLRRNASVREVIVSAVREHSRKPDEIHDRLETYAGERRRLEMFGRRSRPGWHVVGNEATKFDPVPEAAE